MLFTNNICVNSLQCGIKLSSHPLINAETLNNSYNNVISNNIFTWEKDYEFGLVQWDVGKTYSPVGIMLQCHSSTTKISNNVIDMSMIIQVIPNPIQESAGISIIRGATDEGYYYKNIDVTGNFIKPYFNKNISLVVSPYVENLNISGNTMEGKIIISSTAVFPKQFGTLTINANTISNSIAFNYLSLTCNFRKIDITNNIFNSKNVGSGYNSLIELNDITSEYLTISGNSMEVGEIISYSATKLNIKKINISNNFIQAVTLNTHANTLSVNLCGNSIYNAKNTFYLISDSLTTIFNISGNGGYVTGFVNLNQGRIRINGNSLSTHSGTPFTFGASVFIDGGEYWGSGVPTASALSGVRYYDFSVTLDNTYIKTTTTGATGWKKIATI
ncbi:hypothetical protein [Clostridium gasigenes]|uniref:hypothetical protein n=1 Tax=Clostridium gasigenes TaxID=94869 RepID=UPI001C0AD797|nr:hypothetical protein [Clostridium gasigenes]MBU3109904.1 hypothetical protein [Clostridium gasigenes]